MTSSLESSAVINPQALVLFFELQQQLHLSTAQENEPFQLEQSGRITRGIVTGSNQQISLESGLDIQLTGSIGDETQLSAI